MQSGRHVSSVSDLYAGDEISVLLEEIRELEPAACRTEDIQDFEIAGSQTGASGGRTTGSLAELDTPGDVKTVCSWDSHANYTHPEHDGSPSPSIMSDVVVYFDDSYLKGTKGFMRISLVVSYFSVLRQEQDRSRKYEIKNSYSLTIFREKSIPFQDNSIIQFFRKYSE